MLYVLFCTQIAHTSTVLFSIAKTNVELRSCRPKLKMWKSQKSAKSSVVFTLKPFVKKKVEPCTLNCSFVLS